VIAVVVAASTDANRARPRNVFFAAPADDPRARRPVDVAMLVASSIVVALLGWHHRARGDLDGRVLRLFAGQLPGWLSGIATVVFVSGGLYVLGLVVGIAFVGRRFEVARDMVLAIGLCFGLVLVLAYLAGPEFPDLVPELWERNGFPSYPVARLAMAVAAIRVAGPYLSLPLRRVGIEVSVAMSLAAVVMSYGTLSATLGGLALGFLAASAVHLILGSGLGIPSRARIAAALAQIGIVIEQLEYVDRQRAGATLVRVRTVDHQDLLVKVYGRDSAEAAFATRVWRSMWYRSSGPPPSASSEQLAEHESLMLMACERAGVRGQQLVGWSRSATDDSLVITRWLGGRRLGELAHVEIDEQLLDSVWTKLTELHAAGITHAEIEPGRVIVLDAGVALIHFDSARILAGDEAKHADRAQTLVTTAIAAGSNAAIGAARRHLGDEAMREMLPFLQNAALSRGLQHDARAAGVKVGRLRNEAAEAIGAPKPEVVQLQRVSWHNVAMTLLTLFAAYSLITSLTDIGVDTLREQFSKASWGWVLVAFVLAQLTNVGEYVSLAGVIGSPIPFGPTIMFRYALSFIGLAVPSDAGEIAMNIRYQQKLGVPAAAAIAQGPLLKLFSKGFDIILLLISAKFIGEAIDTDELDVGPVVRLFGVVIAVAAVALIVVFAVPRLRAKALPHVREGFGAVKGSVTDPRRLVRVAGGTLAQKILYALTLAASVAAFGGALNFGEAIFVNCAVSLFVGLVPVPGGIGVAETALSGALIAVGVPQGIAVAAAITHRVCTSYIPPVFGWYASRWLTERDYL
jgi:uncharacterized membrane protein YbhN (UPF0104 family)